jgi:hypothetical protein
MRSFARFAVGIDTIDAHIVNRKVVGTSCVIEANLTNSESGRAYTARDWYHDLRESCIIKSPLQFRRPDPPTQFIFKFDNDNLVIFRIIA